MKWLITLVLLAGAALGIGVFLRTYWTQVADVELWQRQVSPGPLSAAHAWLGSSCAACHTPTKSAEGAKCIGCHADNTALLQRQPTAFHESIDNCSGCHIEHRGAAARPVDMDHLVLASIGLRAALDNQDNVTNQRLLAWVRQHEVAAEIVPSHPEVTSSEAALDCVSCHGTKDRHQGYFGGDCASCHGTAAWAIAAFQHPSPRSVECVQCHQPPPSHNMMHFTMVSRTVARAPDARVDQCFLCHQTTSWNDIQGVGWYKHH